MTAAAWTVKRPLLCLLPFFIAGLALGREAAGESRSLWLPAGAALALWTILSLKGKGRSLLLAGLVFFLTGLALSADFFKAPSSPDNAARLTGRPGLVFGGRVSERPVSKDDRTNLVVSVREVLVLDGPARPASGKILLAVQGTDSPAEHGDYIRFPAETRRVHGFGVPGVFDYEAYLAGRRIFATAFLKSPNLVRVLAEPGRFAPLSAWFASLRKSSLVFLETNLEEPARGLFQAMLLGVPGRIDPGLEAGFRKLGLSHLLAVSGLHVGLVALTAFALIRRLLLLLPGLALRVDVSRLTALLTFIPVLFYAGLAGGQPSTFRAATMASVFLAALLWRRRSDALSSLAAAAWAILVIQPGALFMAGFQLSFVAAGALAAVFSGPRRAAEKTETVQGFGARLEQKVKSAFLAALTAGLATAPIIAYHFNYLATWSLPANMILTPLLSLGTIPAGLGALALSEFWPSGAAAAFLVLGKVFNPVLKEISLVGALPGLEVMVPRPGLLFLVGFYSLAGVAALVRPWKKTLALGGAIGFSWLLLFLAFSRAGPDGLLKVDILDVGQGTCIHAALPNGEHLVIDGGGFPGSDFDPGEVVAAPFLLARGVRRIDIAALSHPQEDHVGGLVFLTRHFRPGEIWTNGAVGRCRSYFDFMDLARTMKARRPDLADLHRPQVRGGARIVALWPPPDFLKTRTHGQVLAGMNDDSLVLKVEFGRHAFLFPGDIQARGAAGLLERPGVDPRADVLVAPHHGGKGTLSEALLKAVAPRYVVFTAGRYNKFGFPAPESLDAARKAGARIFRTDLHGAASFQTDGQNLRAAAFRPPGAIESEGAPLE
ncbi:MAG: DNA internalization-related competence protein ComEC/Rec2 [Pseudomonadota bacterium]